MTGLRARGGIEVDLAWSNGKITTATLRRVVGSGPVVVRHGDKTVSVRLAAGESKQLADF